MVVSGESESGGRGEEPRRRPSDTTMTFSAAGPETVEAAEAGLSGEEATAVDALPAGSALLIVQRGPNSGARFLLDSARTTVGRHPDSNIFLDDVTVSRKHAEFVRDDDGFRVRDIGSLNGTYVNRDRVDDAHLRTGDEVQIGKYRMTYHPSRHSGSQGGRVGS
jgi:pSer/pThr/pTyr-binding forkhead associated (FHA) protein